MDLDPPGQGSLGRSLVSSTLQGGSDDHEEKEGVGDDNGGDCDMVDVASKGDWKDCLPKERAS